MMTIHLQIHMFQCLIQFVKLRKNPISDKQLGCGIPTTATTMNANNIRSFSIKIILNEFKTLYFPTNNSFTLSLVENGQNEGSFDARARGGIPPIVVDYYSLLLVCFSCMSMNEYTNYFQIDFD